MNYFPTNSIDVNYNIINYIPDCDIVNLASTNSYFYSLCTNEKFWKSRLKQDYYSSRPDNIPIAQWYRFWRQQPSTGLIVEIAIKLQLSCVQNYNRLRTIQGHINASSINYRNINQLLEWAITSSYNYFDHNSIRFMFSQVDDDDFVRFVQGAVDHYRIDYIRIALSLNRPLTGNIIIYDDTTTTVRNSLQNIPLTILIYTSDYEYHKNMLGFRCCLFEMFKMLLMNNLWDDAEELFNYDKLNRMEQFKRALYATGHFKVAEDRFSGLYLNELGHFLSISHYAPELAFNYYKEHKQTIINSMESAGFIPVLADSFEQVVEYEASSVPYTITDKFYQNNEANLEKFVTTFPYIDTLLDDKFIIFSVYIYKLFDLLIKHQNDRHKRALLGIAKLHNLLDIVEWLEIEENK